MHQRVEDVVAAFARGELVVVTDDDDRENEGDLFIAASLCTPEKMAFIIRHTSGIVCAPLDADEARRLRLDPMVAANDAPLGTAFTVSIDVRHGLTTGISAEERTNTVRALANSNSVTVTDPGSYWINTGDEGRKAVDEQAERKVDIIKIWVDDRLRKYPKLTPEIYGPTIDEAHKKGLRVIAHVFDLADTKGLLKAGVDAFAHNTRDQVFFFAFAIRKKCGIANINEMRVGTRGANRVKHGESADT